MYFESNGGSYVSPYTNIASGTLIVAPKDPVRKGYAFAGWYMEPALKNPWNFKEYGVYNTMTLYAKWNPITNTGVPKAGDEGISPYIALALLSMATGIIFYGFYKKFKKDPTKDSYSK